MSLYKLLFVLAGEAQNWWRCASSFQVMGRCCNWDLLGILLRIISDRMTLYSWQGSGPRGPQNVGCLIDTWGCNFSQPGSNTLTLCDSLCFVLVMTDLMWWADTSCGRACIYCATPIVPIESSRRWSECEIEWKSILLPVTHAELSKIWEPWTQFCLLKKRLSSGIRIHHLINAGCIQLSVCKYVIVIGGEL